MEKADRKRPIPTGPPRAKTPEGCCVGQKQNQVRLPLLHVEPGSTAQVASARGVRSCGLSRWVGRGLGLGQEELLARGLPTWGPGRPWLQCGSSGSSPVPRLEHPQLGVVRRRSYEQPPLVLVATGSPRPRHRGRKSPPGRRGNGPGWGDFWAALICRPAPTPSPPPTSTQVPPTPRMGRFTGSKQLEPHVSLHPA